MRLCVCVCFRDDAERLASKLKKICVADVVESMKVSVVPYFVRNQQVCTIYKLKMKLYPPELYPPYSDITLEDCVGTLEVPFMRELEDSIQSHLLTLSKINTIKIITDKMEQVSIKDQDDDEDGSKSKQAGKEDDDGDDNGDDDGLAEDLGVDALRRKRQAADEMDYEDGLENEMPVVEDEHGGEEHSVGFESEIDQAEPDDGCTLGGENEIIDDQSQVFDAEDETPRSSSRLASKSKSSGGNSTEWKKPKAHLIKKKTDKAILVAAKGLNFEVHFSFKKEPHILLAEVFLPSSVILFLIGSFMRALVNFYLGEDFHL